MKSTETGKIRVKQIRSVNSTPQKTRRIVKSLGLRGIGSEALQKDNNCIRGMINKVIHLIEYELVN